MGQPNKYLHLSGYFSSSDRWCAGLEQDHLPTLSIHEYLDKALDIYGFMKDIGNIDPNELNNETVKTARISIENFYHYMPVEDSSNKSQAEAMGFPGLVDSDFADIRNSVMMSLKVDLKYKLRDQPEVADPYDKYMFTPIPSYKKTGVKFSNLIYSAGNRREKAELYDVYIQAISFSRLTYDNSAYIAWSTSLLSKYPNLESKKFESNLYDVIKSIRDGEFLRDSALKFKNACLLLLSDPIIFYRFLDRGDYDHDLMSLYQSFDSTSNFTLVRDGDPQSLPRRIRETLLNDLEMLISFISETAMINRLKNRPLYESLIDIVDEIDINRDSYRDTTEEDRRMVWLEQQGGYDESEAIAPSVPDDPPLVVTVGDDSDEEPPLVVEIEDESDDFAAEEQQSLVIDIPVENESDDLLAELILIEDDDFAQELDIEPETPERTQVFWQRVRGLISGLARWRNGSQLELSLHDINTVVIETEPSSSIDREIHTRVNNYIERHLSQANDLSEYLAWSYISTNIQLLHTVISSDSWDRLIQSDSPYSIFSAAGLAHDQRYWENKAIGASSMIDRLKSQSSREMHFIVQSGGDGDYLGVIYVPAKNGEPAMWRFGFPNSCMRLGASAMINAMGQIVSLPIKN